MAALTANVGSLIRKILDGKGAAGAKRRLVLMGGPAVDPILAALVGDHGPLHRDNAKRSVDDLINTLELIARKDVRPLAEAMAHDSPAFNIVVWAIGHSNSQQAKRIINSLHDHQDPGVRAVVAYHEARRLRRRPRPASKTTKKTVAKKKPTKKTARRAKARP